MGIDKKKVAAILSAVEIYLEEEKKEPLYKPVMPKMEKRESPWAKSGRYLAMSVRNQCQSRLFK